MAVTTYVFDKSLGEVVLKADWERRNGRLRDHDRPERSMAMGCTDSTVQKRRLGQLSDAGVNGCSYDRTGELLFPAGLDAQRRCVAVGNRHGWFRFPGTVDVG